MSFRKQFRFERSLQNGKALLDSLKSVFVSTLSPRSSAFAVVAHQSWLTMAYRSERPKRKSYIFRWQFVNLLLCFLLGFGLGLYPLRTQEAFVPLKEDSSGRWYGFQAKLQATKVPNISLIAEEGHSFPAVRKTYTVENEDRKERPSSGEKLPSVINGSAIWYHTLAPRKLLIVITTTYTGSLQAFYLTKLAHTLKLVPPPLLWLVVEMYGQSFETATLLRDTGIVYRHLVCDMQVTVVKDRHDHLRNVALVHIRDHQLDGIVYFAGEQNFYSLELFEQLRQVKRFGTWPVAKLAHGKAKTTLYGPVCRGTTVIGWHTTNKTIRRFHVDMSGFGFNSTVLWDIHWWQRPITNPNHHLDMIGDSFQATTFIQQLVEDESQMQGLPSGCSKVMVWSLHLTTLEISYPTSWRLQKSLDAIIR